MSRAVLFVAAAVCAAPAFAETMYFTAIPDLPMAPGLSESENPLGPLFDSDGAELILAAAHGQTSPESVERFYMGSLSPLGWSYEPSPRDEDLAFIRGRERLILHIEPQNGGTYLFVRLIVRPAATNAD